MANLVDELRRLTPRRPLGHEEAMRIAELQANRLLQLADVSEPPVPEEVVAALPRLQVERLASIPVSGSTHWTRGRWLIVLNESESLPRQRFSLFHELKHVLDHQHIAYLYPPTRQLGAHERAEQMADYFAACVLMPKRWVKRDFGNLIQESAVLARRYGTSQMAMRYRLNQLGLTPPARRCAWYERELTEVA